MSALRDRDASLDSLAVPMARFPTADARLPQRSEETASMPGRRKRSISPCRRHSSLSERAIECPGRWPPLAPLSHYDVIRLKSASLIGRLGQALSGYPPPSVDVAHGLALLFGLGTRALP